MDRRTLGTRLTCDERITKYVTSQKCTYAISMIAERLLIADSLIMGAHFFWNHFAHTPVVWHMQRSDQQWILYAHRSVRKCFLPFLILLILDTT